MLQLSTFKFLKHLSKHNEQQWFQKNKASYEAAKTDFESFIEKLLFEINKFDKTISGLKPKDCVFRIYRDVRFSKNKDPYKTHFGAYIAEDGRKSMKPGYYFHVEANGKSMIAGGAYMPPSKELKNLRQEIDYNLQEFEKLLSQKNFKKLFPRLEGQKLKTTPIGYSKDHPAIEILKHKDLLVSHNFSDEELTSKNAVKKVAAGFSIMKPLNDFLSRAYEEV